MTSYQPGIHHNLSETHQISISHAHAMWYIAEENTVCDEDGVFASWMILLNEGVQLVERQIQMYVEMRLCQKLLTQEGTFLQHATIFCNPLPTSEFLGVVEDCLHAFNATYFAVPSCVNSFWSGVLCTSYLICNDLYYDQYWNPSGIFFY